MLLRRIPMTAYFARESFEAPLRRVTMIGNGYMNSHLYGFSFREKQHCYDIPRFLKHETESPIQAKIKDRQLLARQPDPELIIQWHRHKTL